MNERDAIENTTEPGSSRGWLRAAFGIGLLATSAALFAACGGSSADAPPDEFPAGDGGHAGSGGSGGDSGTDADAGQGDADASLDADTGADADVDADASSDADADADDADGDADDADAADDADVLDAQGDGCIGKKCNPEVCNGLDDNGIGGIDEGDPGGGAACDTGQLGICAAGTEHCCTHDMVKDGVACTIGSIACVANQKPSDEVCNGADDNCDGTPDNVKLQPGVAGAPGSPCSTNLPGLCANGSYVCQNATLVCVPNRMPGDVAEQCNGLDDNCDGNADENLPWVGQDCEGTVDSMGNPYNYPQNSPCNHGKYVCNGQQQCARITTPVAEVCNGVDDDCDGVTDGTQVNPHVLENLPCDPTDYPANTPCGAAGSGVTTCTAGQPGCKSTVKPAAEVCNNIDDNCDGTKDNGGSGLTMCIGQVGSNYQSTVTDMTCNAGACTVKTCASGSFNVDASLQNGCECSGNVLSQTQGNPTVFSVTVGSTQTVTGILPTKGSSAWIRVSFSGIQSSPTSFEKLSLSAQLTGSKAGEFVMDAKDSTGNSAQCPIFGGKTDPSDTPNGIVTWEFRLSHSPDVDAHNGNCDTANPNGNSCSDAAPIPGTMLFRVYRKDSAQAATCDTFSLTLSNN